MIFRCCWAAVATASLLGSDGIARSDVKSARARAKI